jgi:hypothetical protein
VGEGERAVAFRAGPARTRLDRGPHCRDRISFTHPNSSTNGNAQMAVEVDTVQPLWGGGYGFNIKTKPYTWLTLHYETTEAAEEGRIHALKATEKATSAHLHRK